MIGTRPRPGETSSGTVIATGSAKVTVASGEPVRATIELAPAAGTGTFTLSASWDSSVTVSGTEASYSDTSLAAGSYTLQITANGSAGGSMTRAYALQAYNSLTSSLSLALTSADFGG